MGSSPALSGFARGPNVAFDERVSLRLSQSGANIETLVGYSLAMCVHPYAVWRSRSARRRAFVLLAYFASGYALVLGALLFSGF